MASLMISEITAKQRKEILHLLRRFAAGNNRRAFFILGNTLVFFWATLYMAHLLLDRLADGGWWIYIVLITNAILTSGLFIRIFLLSHDLNHNSFFRSYRLNRSLRFLTGTLCHTTPTVWDKEHNFHHRHSNNLDFDQSGQSAALSVDQFLRLPRLMRVGYFVANLPPVLYVIMPAAYFYGYMRIKATVWENLAMALWLLLLWKVDLLWYSLVVFYFTAAFGFIVFHLQHTFDGVYKRHDADYDFFLNGVYGSSYWVWSLPRWMSAVLDYFLIGVRYHHIHHLNVRIPAYRLAESQDAAEKAGLLREAARVRFGRVLKTLHYALYNEETEKFESVWAYRKSVLTRPTQ